MAVTLPTLTHTLDNAFLTTWYEIRAEAIDNVLSATPIWAALSAYGCMKTQIGSDLITRTIKYAVSTAVAINTGSMLPTGETELETMARWTFRFTASKVQRDAFKDRSNAGPSKIKDYVGQRLSDSRDSLEQKYESNTLNTTVAAETGDEMQGIHDILPPTGGNFTTGTHTANSANTYGQINRPLTYAAGADGVYVPATGNTFWGGKYLPGTLNTIEDDLLSDMKNLYGACHNNQTPPNFILTTKAIFDIYEEFGLDISQIIKNDAMMMDLGFESLLFKGKPLVWSGSMTANHMIMLNLNFVEVVYDPNMWFAMTEWKPIPLETTRIAHILCAANMISDQLRRHGRLEYA